MISILCVRRSCDDSHHGGFVYSQTRKRRVSRKRRVDIRITPLLHSTPVMMMLVWMIGINLLHHLSAVLALPPCLPRVSFVRLQLQHQAWNLMMMHCSVLLIALPSQPHQAVPQVLVGEQAGDKRKRHDKQQRQYQLLQPQRHHHPRPNPHSASHPFQSPS